MTNAITVRGREQALRRVRGAGQRRFRRAVRLADRAARAQRVGQVDAAACHRRPGSARHRHHHHQRARRDAYPAAAARYRLRVPALRGVQAPDGPRQRRDSGCKIRKRPKAEIKEKVDNLLEVVGLSGFQTRYPNQLSGGQRQRMALARALAVDPQVLLLDEPFGALDAKVREDLRAWLRRLHDEVHVTTVLVTHDQAEALDVADRIAVLNKGRIEQVGSPTEVYDTPGERVRDVVPRRGVVAQRNAGAAARHSGGPQPRHGDRGGRWHRSGHRRACGPPSTGS